MVEITEQLTATTADAPLAALRAVALLERIAARVGWEAAGALAEGGVSAETVATGLGTTRSKALVLLLTAPVGARRPSTYAPNMPASTTKPTATHTEHPAPHTPPASPAPLPPIGPRLARRRRTS
ncbi:hypothetical protein ACFCYC_08160 [Streptomyces sp. NPDC056402]|uniref:hypothetical protein n=1 Tax=Streptomyces sp. NPDC056402 TaxID=3345810 RepID=UPI0035E0E104